jgi:phage shock protein A
MYRKKRKLTLEKNSHVDPMEQIFFQLGQLGVKLNRLGTKLDRLDTKVDQLDAKLNTLNKTLQSAIQNSSNTSQCNYYS